MALQAVIFRVPYTCPTGANFAFLAVLRPRRINNLRVLNGLLGFNSPLQHQYKPFRINWIQTAFFSRALGAPAGEYSYPKSIAHRLPAAPVTSEPTGHNALR